MEDINKNLPKKLSCVYKNKKDKIKLKSIPLNFKTIPNYIDLINRKIERKIIIHTHKIFQNELSNVYNSNYLDSFYENLYMNKRSHSFSKHNIRNSSSSNLLIRKNSFYTTGNIEKPKIPLKLPNINNKKNKMTKELLDFFKGKANMTKLLNVNKKNSIKRKSFSHVKEKKIIYPN